MLIPCPGCARHVRQSESQCPFCAAALPETPQRTAPHLDRLGRAALFAFATAGSAVACGGATPASTAPAGSVATSDPNTPPAATTSPETPPSTTSSPSAPPPSPAPSASVAVAAPSAKSTPPASPGPGDGTLAAAYGAPPMPSSPGIAATPAPDLAPTAGPTTAISDIAVGPGAIANAERVVVGMRAGFRNCYVKGLVASPGAEGKITMTIRVGTAGQVLGVNAHPTDKVPPAVTSCITTRATVTEFDPPTGVKGPKAQVAVDFTVTLAKQ